MLKKEITFPEEGRIRVICDTDAYNEADDQYCIAHLLMTPRFDVRAIIAEQFGNTKYPDTEAKSYEEIHNITRLMGAEEDVHILHGASRALEDCKEPVESEGARFIIEEAMKDDPRPLFVCNTGALTNLACAYLLEPKIADRLTVIWIGGAAYPAGGFEYNLHNDIQAANVVFRSEMEIWQVPKPVYITMKVSFFELLNNVYPYGELGRYLVEHTLRTAEYEYEKMRDPSTPLGSRYLTMSRAAAASSFAGDLWCLGDSPVVGLMMNHTLGRFHMEKVPGIINPDGTYDFAASTGHQIRVYDDIDSHFIIRDFFEKIKYFFG